MKIEILYTIDSVGIWVDGKGGMQDWLDWDDDNTNTGFENPEGFRAGAVIIHSFGTDQDQADFNRPNQPRMIWCVTDQGRLEGPVLKFEANGSGEPSLIKLLNGQSVDFEDSAYYMMADLSPVSNDVDESDIPAF